MTTLTRHALTTLRDTFKGNKLAQTPISNIIELMRVPVKLQNAKWRWLLKLNHDLIAKQAGSKGA